jgi:cation diffusion facilitator CzcD-associated flavoprotein CzcO
MSTAAPEHAGWPVHPAAPHRPSPQELGLHRFGGQVILASPGDAAEPLAGRRVALIAAGDAAVALVPGLVRTTGRLKVFLTDPVWVLPDLTLLGRWRVPDFLFQLPLVESGRRLVVDWVAEAMRGDPLDRLTAVAEWFGEVSLRLQVRDPWMRRQLTPDRRWSRPPVRFSSDFYGALVADNCELVTWPVTAFSAAGVRTGDGIEHHVDTIVLVAGAAKAAAV